MIAGVALVALLVAPRHEGAPLAEVLNPSSFTVLQYLAPFVAAMLVLVGVPLVLQRRSAAVRVAGLKPRRLRDFVHRPVLLLLAPCGAALAVVGTAVWQSGSSTNTMLANYTLISDPDGRIRFSTDPHERISVTQRDVGFSPGWKVLFGIAVAVALVALVSWLVLRVIRDAAPAVGGELTSAEVRLRRTLSGIVLTVGAAAQAATAGLVITAAGSSMQSASLWTSARYTPVRVMGSNTYEFHPGAAHQLQPEWALATVELLVGAVLLVVAVVLVVHVVRLISVISARSKVSAVLTVA